MQKTRCDGEGNIRLRKDGRYEVRLSGGIDFSTGQPIRISRYAKTEGEAIQLLHQLSLTIGKSNRIHNQNITLAEWLDLWMEVYMKHNLKQSTQAGYETYARKHFKPALGQIRLIDITPQLLQQFYNYKMEAENLSPKTINNLNMYLHKALEQAFKEGIIPANPASALNLPRASRPQVEILTRDEQAQLIRASRQHRYGVFVRLVLATGLRLGELLGLRWEDIDFRLNMLHIRRTLNRLPIVNRPENYQGRRTEIVIQEPKTQNSVRTIPLHAGVLQDLLQWRRVQDTDRAVAGEKYVDSGMIVTNPLGGYVEPRTFADYYHQMLQMAGLRHFNFHALRHTFASRAMEQGMDNKTLSVLLGHYSVAFTMDTYAHVLDDHKWEGMQLMEDLYTIDQSMPTQQLYPILLTPDKGGGYLVTAPDFSQVQFHAATMEEGIVSAQQTIQEAVLSMVYPPSATELGAIQVLPGQFAMQVMA